MDNVITAVPEEKKPFAALRIVAAIIEVLAWAALVITPVVAFIAATESGKDSGWTHGPDPMTALFAGLVAGGLTWLGCMFSSQSITVILAIEENTRKAAEKLGR